MSADLFRGQLVRLTAEDPEPLAKSFSRWSLDTEYFRLLDSEPPRPFSEKIWKEWMEKNIEKTHQYGFSIRALEEDPAQPGRILGFIALFETFWNQGDTLVAIALGEREYWGKGYGTDAMRLMMRYAFDELNLRRVSLLVFEYNTRAIRSYEKVGFVLEGRVRGAMLRDGRRWDWLYMGILREEWACQGKRVVEDELLMRRQA